MQIHASVYCRVSTAAQAEPNRISIPEQIRLCKALIHKNTWALCKTYIDPGYSSNTLNRPGLQQMLKELESFDVLVVYDPDRLSRDNALVEGTIYNELDAHRVQLTSVTQPVHIVPPQEYDPKENDTVFIQRRISGLSGGLDNRRRRRRLSAGIDAKERSGYCCKPRAYGYTAEWKQHLVNGRMAIEKTTQIVESEAAIVKRIFKEYVAGSSALGIAQQLNTDGIPSKKNATWNFAVVLDILRNPVYIGKVRKNVTPVVNGKKIRNPRDKWIVVDGKHPPIISTEVFECAQRVLARRSKQRRAFSSPRLLSGLVKCGYCGWSMAMTGAYNAGLGRYFCNKWKNSKQCRQNPIRIGLLEKEVLGEINSLARDPELLRQVETMDRGGEERSLRETLSTLTHKARQYPSRQKVLFELLETGAITRQEFVARKQEQEEEVAELNQRIDKCSDDLQLLLSQGVTVDAAKRVLEDFIDNYKQYDFSKIKSHLSNLIDEIRVTNGKCYIKYRFSTDLESVVAFKDATRNSSSW